ncbi:MAG: hypothetical protein HRU34_19540 [Richelia sp.]|nr:hypothetical protein [Richelia sp.]CDN14719.1 hypothetical protein RintRC_0596 [Richelia intracellularis]
MDGDLQGSTSVLDKNYPTGWDFLAQLRQEKKLQDLPVMMMTFHKIT